MTDASIPSHVQRGYSSRIRMWVTYVVYKDGLRGRGWYHRTNLSSGRFAARKASELGVPVRAPASAATYCSK